MIRELNEFEIKEIKRYASGKLGECRKGHDIIGTQIFSVLSLYARVIYYPLGKNAPWGFTRMSGSQNQAALEKPFVAINTSIPVDCQVFAAAHELYHIWYEKNPDVISADLLNEQDKAIDEKKANRFAAEFLVDELLLKQEIDLYKISTFTVKSILQLCEVFVVPYRTMAKRLQECGFITKAELKHFLEESEETICKYRKLYSFTLNEPDERIALDNLVELAVDAYESKYITFEKLEYLLELSNLTTEELGIYKQANYEIPSDEELDYIMEEPV